MIPATTLEEQQILATIPQEFIDAVVVEAEADAERVALFFKFFRQAFIEIHGDAEAVDCFLRHFTEQQLLELAALLRIRIWQSQGLIKQEMNLPTITHDIFKQAMLMMFRPGAKSVFTVPVLTAFYEHFAWSARSKFGANIQLDQLPEDEFVEQLANYLWEHRNDL